MVRQVSDSDPTPDDTIYRLARAYYFAERWPVARETFARVSSLHPGDPVLHEAVAAAAMGDRETAEERLTAAERPGTPDWWVLLWRARVAAQLGNHDESVRILAEGIASGLLGIYPWLHADLALGPVLTHPAFRRILEPRG